MKVLAIGSKQRITELKAKLPDDIDVVAESKMDVIAHALPNFDVLFHLTLNEDPHALTALAPLEGKLVVAGAVKISLAQAAHSYGQPVRCALIGMNTLPTFINRDLVEWSLLKENHQPAGDQLAEKLGWKVKWVKDRVGMVTPRIILMLINEACFTVQEGTASMTDIDLGMKLGTNYPYGPFEWGDQIGVDNVYETLQALYEDTGDMRYRPCPLLKRKHLRKEPFLL